MYKLNCRRNVNTVHVLSHYRRNMNMFCLITGFCGPNTLHKTVSTTFFLYFACILPSIALGVLNYKNTGGQLGQHSGLSFSATCHLVERITDVLSKCFNILNTQLFEALKAVFSSLNQHVQLYFPLFVEHI